MHAAIKVSLHSDYLSHVIRGPKLQTVTPPFNELALGAWELRL